MRMKSAHCFGKITYTVEVKYMCTGSIFITFSLIQNKRMKQKMSFKYLPQIAPFNVLCFWGRSNKQECKSLFVDFIRGLQLRHFIEIRRHHFGLK